VGQLPCLVLVLADCVASGTGDQRSGFEFVGSWVRVVWTPVFGFVGSGGAQQWSVHSAQCAVLGKQFELGGGWRPPTPWSLSARGPIYTGSTMQLFLMQVQAQ
jgi:hypothetical protein